MKVAVELELVPFTVPEYVSVKSTGKREDGFKMVTITLGDLDEMTLNTLCDTFVQGVHSNAKLQRERVESLRSSRHRMPKKD